MVHLKIALTAYCSNHWHTSAKHPFCSLNDELRADSREDISPWYTPEYYELGPIPWFQILQWRLKFLRGQSRAPICQNGNFFCHLVFKVFCCQAIDLAPYGTLWVLKIAHAFSGISQLDCYFLRSLLTGYSNLLYFWSKDFPPFKKKLLDWTSIVSFMTDDKHSRCVYCT
jgi:hypothetical protein